MDITPMLDIPICLTKGARGYFHMMDAYEKGRYEAGVSGFKAGVAEPIIRKGQTLLGQQKEA